jgi:predicted transcriptional regulator
VNHPIRNTLRILGNGEIFVTDTREGHITTEST